MLDEVLQVLANKHRRQLLAALLDQRRQEVVQISESVEGDAEQWSNLQVKMRHHHLPRLEDAGYIRWKKQQRVVVRGPAFDEVKPILELFDENAEELPVEWP